jgi:hypothetical protein
MKKKTNDSFSKSNEEFNSEEEEESFDSILDVKINEDDENIHPDHRPSNHLDKK